MKMNSLKRQKHGYIINIISNNAIKGTVRNRAQPSFYEGRSLQITLLLCQGLLCTKIFIKKYLLDDFTFCELENT